MDYQYDFCFPTTRWHDAADGAWLSFRLVVVAIVFGFILGTLLVVVCIEAAVWNRGASVEPTPKGTEPVAVTFWLALFCQTLRRLMILRLSLERTCPSLVIRSGLKSALSRSYERSRGPETFTGCCHG